MLTKRTSYLLFFSGIILALSGFVWGVGLLGEAYVFAPVIVFVIGISINLLGFINLWLLTKDKNEASRSKQPWEE
jgi:hypothetical protein